MSQQNDLPSPAPSTLPAVPYVRQDILTSSETRLKSLESRLKAQQKSHKNAFETATMKRDKALSTRSDEDQKASSQALHRAQKSLATLRALRIEVAEARFEAARERLLFKIYEVDTFVRGGLDKVKDRLHSLSENELKEVGKSLEHLFDSTVVTRSLKGLAETEWQRLSSVRETTSQFIKRSINFDVSPTSLVATLLGAPPVDKAKKQSSSTFAKTTEFVEEAEFIEAGFEIDPSVSPDTFDDEPVYEAQPVARDPSEIQPKSAKVSRTYPLRRMLNRRQRTDDGA